MKLNKKMRYLNMIMVVIISYIGIKAIDHFDVILNQINKYTSLLKPFILSFIFAYLLNPMVSLLERRFKLKRGMSILITYIGIIGIMVVFISYILPIITSNIIEIIKDIPNYSKTAQNWLSRTVANNKTLSMINQSNALHSNIKSYVPKLSNLFILSLDAVLKGTVAVTTSLLSIIFGFIIAIYVLLDKEKFIEFGKKIVYILLKKKNGDKFFDFAKTLHSMIGIYIGAKALDSTIIGLIAFIGIFFLKSPYVLLISLIVGITNMIVYLGPFIGIIIAVTINLFYSPANALWILIFLLLLQQFDGWYLDPKLTGGKVGMHPFLAILAVTLGGAFMGIPGMVLGIPTMAVIKIYVDQFMARNQVN